ncbi:ComEC/Rec2 family competence protein [Nocardioides campestrisoli]|uniref:ComEC/Rec2 family competence protein n=1 Tax=Nocardioides campestrisoli TaxID=2736757 RepID=UPI0028119573|nr:ComEC/Rec2 family competence protein [Nocardioides campestrisoli]
MPALERSGRRPGEQEQSRPLPDLRTTWLAAAAWAGGLCGLRAPEPVVAVSALVLVALLLLALLGRGPARSPARAAAVLMVAVVLVGGWARTTSATHGPVAELAAQRAWVEAELVVTSDPRPVAGRFGEQVLVRGTVREVAGGGRHWQVRSPVVVVADPDWREVALGSTVSLSGRLQPAEGDVAALLRPRAGPPSTVAEPDVWWRAASVVRAGIRRAVEPRPEDQRVLVPSLVVGDDAGLDPGLADDFRTTGLTHLLAVSGTNLTLMVGFLLVAGRWLGVRGRGRYVLAAVGIVGFVLLARTEPSVVRAATMGSIALLAFTSNGRDRGIRTLGAAVVVLLMWDPTLAVTAGFALSVLATAGILLLAPGWRDAARRWLPPRVAEAVAVPAAAQLACTPVVAALSGEVSLVAVLANVLVAPAVAPATVLGLLGGLCAVVWPALGQWVAWPAALSVGWVISVARWGAGLPVPAVTWGTSLFALALLTGLCVLGAILTPRLLARPVPTLLLCLAVLLAVVVPRPIRGWPPPGWLLVACDVGQGDALVVRSGPGSAVVVDAGPEPAAADRCLDRLGVREVSLLVLTHYHQDHVGGLSGVLDGRRVAQVWASPLADPPEGAAEVARTLGAAGLQALPAPYLEIHQVGAASVQPVWPGPGLPLVVADGDGANDASVVLLVEVDGVRLLLTGDIEPPAQAGLGRAVAGLRVDVLKVPHHGSRAQDMEFLTSLGARVALVPVGEDNGYGHPAPELLAALTERGTRVLRTDTSGDLAVVQVDSGLGVASLE